MTSAPGVLETLPLNSFNSPNSTPAEHISMAGSLLDPDVRNEILAFERETAEVNLVVGAFVNVLSGRYLQQAEQEETLEAVRRYATETLEVGQASVRIALWEAKRKVGLLALLTAEC